MATGAFLSLFSLVAKEKIALDFVRDVKPVLEFNCVSCHQETKAKGKLRLDTHEQLLKGAGGDAVVVAGKPEESTLYTTTELGKDDDDVMPPIKHETDSLLTGPEKAILKQWIAEGAKWPKGVTLKAQKRQLPEKVEFVKHIQPILELNCVSCHGSTKDKGDLRLDTKAHFEKGGDNGAVIVPGKPLESSLLTLVLLDEVKKALDNFEGCKVIDERSDGGYSSPVEAAGKDETFVSRIREDKTTKNGLNLWIVSDNLLRGAALNAVEIAEILIKNNFYGK